MEEQGGTRKRVNTLVGRGLKTDDAAHALQQYQSDDEHSRSAFSRFLLGRRSNKNAVPRAREQYQSNDELPRIPRGRSVAEEVSIGELGANDIVIAVMGSTGSGKSSFIRYATGRDSHGIGHALRSFTSEVVATRFWDQESRKFVVLVDTPGFDDTFKSDLDILNLISDWLASSYSKHKLLSGILYLHRITDNRMAGTSLKNLRVFRKLCGRDALDRVYLTTTMWDEVDEDVGEKRLDQLVAEYWKTMINQGAKIARCRNDDGSPKKLIRDILFEEDSRKPVLLQDEMVELKKELRDTAAGQQLYSQLEILVEKQMELLRRIDKSKKAASEAAILEELRTEYNELRAQIDDRLRQMQELKLPWLKRFFARRRD